MPPQAQQHSDQGLHAPSQHEGPQWQKLPLHHQARPFHSHHYWSCHGILLLCHEYYPNQTHWGLIEWLILPYNNDSGAFSEGGDSRSIIAFGTSEFGGLLIGGSGKTELSDTSYAMLMHQHGI